MKKNKDIYTKQRYSKYTEEDFEVWEKLYERQMKYLLKGFKCSRYFFDGIRELSFNKDTIPKFTEVNKVLKKTTGWKIKAVTGIIDDDIFFELLRKKTFPVSTWLRDMDSLDYLEEPDMFHDLFGHVPFLVHSNYTRFLERIGNHAKSIFESNDKERQRTMSRLYWYTIEFGMVKRSNTAYDIYGAGILSSYKESKRAIRKDSKKKPFRIELLTENFYKHDVQDFYAYIHKDLKFLNLIKVEEI